MNTRDSFENIPPYARARNYIAKCPPAISGQGGHNAAFRVAAVLVHGFALSLGEALALLCGWNQYCQPPWRESDLRHKINSAANATHRQPRGYLLGEAASRSQSPGGTSLALVKLFKPKFNPEMLQRIAAMTADIKDVVRFISDRSPVPVDAQDTASVLRRLYPKGSGEKVIVFNDMKSAGQLVWEADRSDWVQARHLPQGADGVWFLPQPVDGKFHPNPRADGNLSRRSEESVTAWRYAVLESDEAKADDWLRCLVQLPLPITSICDSGGRSIHALVRVDAASKADWDSRIGAIKPLLITLGADPGALTAVRLSRLPQAKRGDRLQRLLFLNAQPGGIPILNQPTHAARQESGGITK